MSSPVVILGVRRAERRDGVRIWAGAVAAVLLGSMVLGAPATGLAGEGDGPGSVGLLWLPDAAPVGVVIALYDTTGIDPRGWHYAEQITAAGIAVLHVDLQDTSSEDGSSAADVHDPAAALVRLRWLADILAEDPRFAEAPIGLLAFGGAGLAATLAAADPDLGHRIAALALLYPGCAALDAAVATEGSAPRAPVLLLHGDADLANSPADCMGLAARLARGAPADRAQPVRRVQYAGAGFAWDLPPAGQFEAPNLPWPGRPGERLAVRFWPGGAALSATQAASFFAATLVAHQP